MGVQVEGFDALVPVLSAGTRLEDCPASAEQHLVVDVVAVGAGEHRPLAAQEGGEEITVLLGFHLGVPLAGDVLAELLAHVVVRSVEEVDDAGPSVGGGFRTSGHMCPQ